MVDEMVEWFFENYEDPVERVPYESAEGGYQYYAGGPYEARDVLFEQFPNAKDQEIEEAVSRIESQGVSCWVRSADYSSGGDCDKDYEVDFLQNDASPF